ncbi:hypothetical protein TNCV_680571 [Trichonephila clavipes]|nr:hypothetical protein TNCV_680571 [Trichonephila clavipes]
MHTLQDALFIAYKQPLDYVRCNAFSLRTSSIHLIEGNTFNDSDISGVTYNPASQGGGWILGGPQGLTVLKYILGIGAQNLTFAVGPNILRYATE